MSIKNTYAGQIQKAWERGYTTGRAGNEGASEPYLDGGFTAGLVRNWRDGYQQGLAEWRAEQLEAKRKLNEIRMAKGQAV